VRWFQINETPSMISELGPLHIALPTDASSPLPSATIQQKCHPQVVERNQLVKNLTSLYQSSLANTHDLSRYMSSSSTWSRMGHFSGCGKSRRASPPSVQQRFSMANQRKGLQQGGAQDFQIKGILQVQNKWIPGRIKALYAEREEKTLVALFHQRCL
jgi:hypothetical protein